MKPARIGGYEVTAVIGRGKSSVVYRAFDAKARCEIALKTIERSVIEQDIRGNQVVRGMRREARATGALGHPGIVRTFDFGEDESFYFFAMEYIEGRNLGDYFASDRRFDEADVVNVITQVLAALEYAHDHATWHFDLKPSNILIASDGRVLLGDFGVDTRDGLPPGSVAGTPGYISPERYLGTPADHRADLFAAGAIFYQLLAGHAAFEGSNDAIMHSVCYRQLDVPSRGDPARRWPQYDAVVERALMKRPEERFPSAGAFRAAALAAYAYPLDDTLPAAALEVPPAKGPPSVQTRSIPPSVAPSVPSTAGPLPGAPEGWDANVLGKVERELAKALGPIAKVLVTRGARAHASLDALIAALTESIEAPAQREAFLTAVRRLSPSVSAGPSSRGPLSTASVASSGPPTLSQDEIDLAIRLLATHIGPVARVVVTRSARENVQRSELYRRLALEIDNTTARDAFLRAAGVLF